MKEEIIGNCRLILGDALETMKELENVDCIVTDPPFGTKAYSWDLKCDPVALANGRACVTFSVQPLTSELVVRHLKSFRYDLVWAKNTYKSNSFDTRPGRQHETILVFGCDTYNPQKRPRTTEEMGRLNREQRLTMGFANPGSILQFDAINSRDSSRTGHPCEKPIDLMQWLVETYTNAGDTVADFFMGSGTTAIACIRTGRKFIGVEIDPTYFSIACRRIEKEVSTWENSLYYEPEKQQQLFHEAS